MATKTAPASVEMERFGAEIRKRYAANGKTDQTLYLVGKVVHDLERVGVRSPDDIDADAVRRYMALRPELAVKSLIARQAMLRAVCKEAYPDLLPSMPDFPPEPRESRAAVERRHADDLDDADVVKLMRLLRSESNGRNGLCLFALAATAAYAGLRTDELRELMVDDIDLAARTIFVRRREFLVSQEIGSPPRVKLPAGLVAMALMVRTLIEDHLSKRKA